LNTN